MNTAINHFADTWNTSTCVFNNFINFSEFNISKEDGSITCKIKPDYIGSSLALWEALYQEPCLNMGTFCDDQCMGNYEMATLLYDCYFDLLYFIPYSVCEKFQKGEKVTIYCRVPDEIDREMIEEVR